MRCSSRWVTWKTWANPAGRSPGGDAGHRRQLHRRRWYETAPCLNSEPQNFESAGGGSKGGIAFCSIFFKIDRSTQKLTTGRSTMGSREPEYITSILDIHYSIFAFSEFLFRLICFFLGRQRPRPLNIPTGPIPTLPLFEFP